MRARARELDASRDSGDQLVDPNIVVLDLVMPDMDGFQAARWIRDRDPHGNVRLIALTGVESPDTLERGASAGSDRPLRKPVPGRTLLGALVKPFEARDSERL
jgi:CheY-like chemotaxis protein